MIPHDEMPYVPAESVTGVLTYICATKLSMTTKTSWNKSAEDSKYSKKAHDENLLFIYGIEL